MDKKALRDHVQKQIEYLSLESRQAESDEICKNLIQKLNQKNFQTLITYLPFADEINIVAVTNYFREV